MALPSLTKMAGLTPTNVNMSMIPQPMIAGLVTIPPQSPSDRILDACATIRHKGGSWTAINGGYTYPLPGGPVMPHLTAHMNGSIPAGGNVGYLDCHVAWKKFNRMTALCSAGVLAGILACESGRLRCSIIPYPSIPLPSSLNQDSDIIQSPCFVSGSLPFEEAAGEIDFDAVGRVREEIVQPVNGIAEKAIVSERAG